MVSKPLLHPTSCSGCGCGVHFATGARIVVILVDFATQTQCYAASRCATQFFVPLRSKKSKTAIMKFPPAPFPDQLEKWKSLNQ